VAAAVLALTTAQLGKRVARVVLALLLFDMQTHIQRQHQQQVRQQSR
jgi:hypothetical protein